MEDDAFTGDASSGILKSCSSSKSSLNSHVLVQSTVKDLFRVQQDALAHVQNVAKKQKLNSIEKSDFEKIRTLLEQERLEHSKSRLLLQKETEKVEFISSENEILKQQILKEREANETTVNHLRSKASREAKRCDFLHEKCMEAEKLLEKQECSIKLKDAEISALKQKLKLQKDFHRQTLEDIDINKMQQDYVVKNLTKS